MSDFYVGLAEIFEVSAQEINPDFNLVEHNWDSLAIVSTIALLDDCFGIMIDGKLLGKCERVADIEALVAKEKGSS